jgi:hypothetical protein
MKHNYPNIKINQGYLEVDGKRIDTISDLNVHYYKGKAGKAEVTIKLDAMVEIEGTAEIKEA